MLYVKVAAGNEIADHAVQGLGDDDCFFCLDIISLDHTCRMGMLLCYFLKRYGIYKDI